MLANFSLVHSRLTPEVLMRLSRQKALLLALVSSIACHSTTDPATVSAFFVLKTINGRPLPTYLAATPGPTATIIYSALTLDNAGKAVMTEHRQDLLQGDATYTNTFDYRIQGDQIEIGSFEPCPINANCVANRIGTISRGHLSLVINPAFIDGKIVYEYQLIGND